ncbi:MAG: DUF4337 family protein [Vulcanimicrobiaceae bacterium]
MTDGDPSRWLPIAAAVLALLAASSGFAANLRVAQSQATRSTAIILATRAADAYGEYDERSVKQHVYEAALVGTADPKRAGLLRSVAQHEATAKAPLLRAARSLDQQSRAEDVRAGRLLESHEILAVSATLFEIAIVLVSAAALVKSRLLPISAAIATVVALAIATWGFFF